ncbi:MAG: hypothetical protein J6U82_04405 [Alistipes sp.]|nr:hypothetical protein [Alistipes sp.]
MKKLVCFIATALLLTACGGKKNAENPEESTKPAYTPTELTADKDLVYLESRKIKITPGVEPKGQTKK